MVCDVWYKESKGNVKDICLSSKAIHRLTQVLKVSKMPFIANKLSLYTGQEALPMVDYWRVI